MAAVVSRYSTAEPTLNPAQREPAWLRVLLISGALLVLALLLLIPLLAVFAEALRRGWEVYVAALSQPDALAALRLSLTVAAVVVPLNVVIGLAAAWLLTRFNFRGKSLLITLIDLPFAVSPVVAGLVYVLLFGANGWFGPWLLANDIKIIFAPAGIILATLFITFPFVARELIPLMQAQGADEEHAPLSSRGFL